MASESDDDQYAGVSLGLGPSSQSANRGSLQGTESLFSSIRSGYGVDERLLKASNDSFREGGRLQTTAVFESSQQSCGAPESPVSTESPVSSPPVTSTSTNAPGQRASTSEERSSSAPNFEMLPTRSSPMDPYGSPERFGSFTRELPPHELSNECITHPLCGAEKMVNLEGSIHMRTYQPLQKIDLPSKMSIERRASSAPNLEVLPEAATAGVTSLGDLLSPLSRTFPDRLSTEFGDPNAVPAVDETDGECDFVASDGEQALAARPYGLTVGMVKKGSPKNMLTTAKYKWYSFCIVNLYFQFRKVSNFYFLLNAIGASMPFLDSPIGPMAAVLPLIFVVGIAMVKDAIEDFNRHRADTAANSVCHTVVPAPFGASPSAMIGTKCSDVKVGDVVLLTKSEVVPADCVILATSMQFGVCFCSTAALDGENALKRRSALKSTQAVLAAGVVNLNCVNIRIGTDRPHPSLVQFDGVLEMTVNKDAGVSNRLAGCWPLSTDQLLFRGSLVRNTDWVIAAVVYTGKYTKVSQNLLQMREKYSYLDKKLNWLVFSLLIVNQCCILLLAALSLVTTYAGDTPWYLGDVLGSLNFSKTDIVVSFLKTYVSLFILLSYMMPISLFVTLELCKTVQAKMMSWDPCMHYQLGGEKKICVAKTSNLHEELSRVHTIMTDKTGTLTNNEMALRGLAVATGSSFPLHENVYPHDSLPDNQPKAVAALYDESDVDPGAATYENHFIWPLDRADIGVTSCALSPEIGVFLRAIALCHDVIRTEDGAIEGPSNDEVALVSGCERQGVSLLAERDGVKDLKCPAPVKFPGDVNLEAVDSSITSSYATLATCPFSPDRKRMSVIVQSVPFGYEKTVGAGPTNTPIVLISKGADSHMIPLFGKDECVVTAAARDKVLTMWSVKGLRTLVYGMKVISAVDFRNWHARQRTASLLREGRDKALEALYAEIENGMQYIGITAVEDKLQDGVPETINYLLRAGITIWVLTGDKRETALSVAVSAGLVSKTRDMILSIAANTKEECLDLFKTASSLATKARQRNMKTCILVDGPTLEYVFESPKDSPLRELFQHLLKHVTCGICCRMTPWQKSEIVRLRQKGGEITCLAVGDGANDVSMITSARVGVGIQGLEGNQASLASDYSIPRFKHLLRLLAVHGRFSYIRNALMIQYSFYKNLLLSVQMIIFSFYTMFSQQVLVFEYILTSFNSFILFLPPFAFGTVDKDLPDYIIERHPESYAPLATGQSFSSLTLFGWFASAISHSFFIYYLWSQQVQHGVLTYPYSDDLWSQTTLLVILVVLTVMFKGVIHTRIWTVMHVLAMFLSWAACVLVIGICSYLTDILGNYAYHGVGEFALAQPVLWLYLPAVVAAALVPDVVILYVRRYYAPSLREALLERYSDDKASDKAARALWLQQHRLEELPSVPRWIIRFLHWKFACRRRGDGDGGSPAASPPPERPKPSRRRFDDFISGDTEIATIA